jgi:hypothetical protein
VSLAVAAGDFAAKASAIPAVTAANVKVYSGPTKVQNGSTWTDLSAAQRRIDVALPLNYSDVGYVKYRVKYSGDTGWAYIRSANGANSAIADRFNYVSGSADSNHLSLKTASVNLSRGTRYKVTATTAIKTNYSSVVYDGSTIGNFVVSGVGSLPSIVTSGYADGYVTGTGNSVNNKPVWQVGSTSTYVGIDGTSYTSGITTGFDSIGNAVPLTVTVNGTSTTKTVYVPVTYTTSTELPETVELKFATDNSSDNTETSSTGTPYSVSLSAYTPPANTSGFSVVR